MEVLLHTVRVWQWTITPASTGGSTSAAAAAAAAESVGSAIALGVPDCVEAILRWSLAGIFFLPDETVLETGAAPGAVPHPLAPLLPLALACVRFCEELLRSAAGLARLERLHTRGQMGGEEEGGDRGPGVQDEGGEAGDEAEGRGGALAQGRGGGDLVEIVLVCLQCDKSAIIEAGTACVSRLCASAHVHAALLAGHVHLLLLRQLLRDVHCMMDGGGGGGAVGHHVVRRRSLATVQALGQFVKLLTARRAADGGVRGGLGQGVVVVPDSTERELSALLTWPMLERLAVPDDFLALFAGETRTPEIVWGDVNRRELAVAIKTAFRNIHVTSPKTPGGPSGAPPWHAGGDAGSNQSMVAAGAGAVGAGALPRQWLDDFCFSNVRGLTRVGGIYIEVRGVWGACVCRERGGQAYVDLWIVIAAI